MAKFLESVIFTLTFLALLAAAVWFGGPMIWRHAVSAESALQALPVVQAADTKAANQQQTSCTNEIAASVKAGAAIARISQPTPAGPQKLITADDINEAIQ